MIDAEIIHWVRANRADIVFHRNATKTNAQTQFVKAGHFTRVTIYEYLTEAPKQARNLKTVFD